MLRRTQNTSDNFRASNRHRCRVSMDNPYTLPFSFEMVTVFHMVLSSLTISYGMRWKKRWKKYQKRLVNAYENLCLQRAHSHLPMATWQMSILLSRTVILLVFLIGKHVAYFQFGRRLLAQGFAIDQKIWNERLFCGSTFPITRRYSSFGQTSIFFAINQRWIMQDRSYWRTCSEIRATIGGLT